MRVDVVPIIVHIIRYIVGLVVLNDMRILDILRVRIEAGHLVTGQVESDVDGC
jgi:hypothetical protein